MVWLRVEHVELRPRLDRVVLSRDMFADVDVITPYGEVVRNEQRAMITTISQEVRVSVDKHSVGTSTEEHKRIGDV